MRLTHASRIAIRPISICGCVDLRAVPSARAANNLLALPLFLLAVERCALTCVASIICVSVARVRPASSRNRISHTLRHPAHKAIVDSGRRITLAAATSQKMNDAGDDAEIMAETAGTRTFSSPCDCSSLTQGHSPLPRESRSYCQRREKRPDPSQFQLRPFRIAKKIDFCLLSGGLRSAQEVRGRVSTVELASKDEPACESSTKAQTLRLRVHEERNPPRPNQDAYHASDSPMKCSAAGLSDLDFRSMQLLG